MAKLTLWKALEQYHIVIPTIQRDYAQGRKNDPKIAQIRKTFLQALVQSLTKNQELELDFVYGSLNHKTLELLDEPPHAFGSFDQSVRRFFVANRVD
jgi:hypothetical protein